MSAACAFLAGAATPGCAVGAHRRPTPYELSPKPTRQPRRYKFLHWFKMVRSAPHAGPGHRPCRALGNQPPEVRKGCVVTGAAGIVLAKHREGIYSPSATTPLRAIER